MVHLVTRWSVEDGLSSMNGELGHELAVGLGVLPQVVVDTDRVHTTVGGAGGVM